MRNRPATDGSLALLRQEQRPSAHRVAFRCEPSRRIQYSGRLHRLHPAKKEVRIYDYVDRAVPMLLRMFEKRLPTYRAIGYARGDAPLGFAERIEETTVEYDEAALRHFREDV